MKPINPKLKNIFLGLLIFLIGWLFSFLFHTKEIKIEDKLKHSENTEPRDAQIEPRDAQKNNPLISENQSTYTSHEIAIPSYVIEVLNYIELNQKAPEGFVGGRTFKNREGLLPKKDENGKLFFYQEWDVHLKERGKNRGAERLVTSNLGNAYYTKDHYQSFIKIK
jgi:ribonuclease T1